MKNFFNYWQTLITSENYLSLRKGSKLLFQYMLLESEKSSNGVFEFPLKLQAMYGYYHNGQFYVDKAELENKGFITVVYSGKNDRLPNLYRISNKWQTVQTP